MPTYDFVCIQCGHKFSRRVAVEARNEVVCTECGGRVKQVFSALEFLRSSCGGFSGFG